MPRNERYSEADLIMQAIDCLWKKHQYEEAIKITMRLLRKKSRHPLYFLILSDCYAAMCRDKGYKFSEEESERYWKKAFAYDTRFKNSSYFVEGIKLAAKYIRATQNRNELRNIFSGRLENLIQNGQGLDKIHDIYLDFLSVSEDEETSLNCCQSAKWDCDNIGQATF
jgi:hypothetical protein